MGDVRNAGAPRLAAQQRHVDERVHRRRRIAEAVDQLVGDVVGVRLGADERDAAVKVHALLGARDILLRDVRRDGEVGRALGAHGRLFALFLEHGLFEQL